MTISQEKLMEIRERANIVDIISSYVPLEQRGRNYFGVCPFHDDHNPSMSVSPQKQIYKCFVCGATGNVFTFVMEYEQISFLEAVKLVASKVGIDVEIGNYKEETTDNEYSKYYKIYDIANKYYLNNLNTQSGKEAKEYLNKRDINEDIIKEFQIGLSTTNKLYQILKEKKYSDEDLIECGICSTNNDRVYDTFINRIMFPLWNLEGKVVGFSGRIYNTTDPSKYVNSKESDIFKKGKLLYNYHRAKEEIRRKRSVIITEGFMDVIALYKIGIKNVIATMGTAVTSEQAHLIKKLSNNVILMFDGDDAGNKATLACSKELIDIGCVPKIVRLPDNLDPDEYIIKYGKDNIVNLLEEPKTYLNYKIDYYKSNTNFNNTEDIANYIRNVISELKNENDILVRELTLKTLSDETKISFSSLEAMIKEDRKVYNLEKVEKKEEKILNKYDKAERRLLYYMLRYEEVIKIYNNNKVFLPTQKFRFLASEIVYFYKKYGNINIADFITYLFDKKELIEAISEINLMDINENYLYDEIMDYINLINCYNVEVEIKRLTNLFKSETDEIKKAEIGKKISELKVGIL